jgi:hypothetical protein
MTEQLRGYADRVEFGEEFYRAQIVLCVQASIGIVVSKAAIKSMEVASNWKDTLAQKFGGIKTGISTPVREVGGGVSSPVTQSREHGPSQSNTRRVVGSEGKSKKQQGGGNGMGPPAASSAVNGKHIGLAMICSQSVAGSNVKGMRVKSKGANCDVCKGEHFPFECPKAFGETYPGRSMPGWSEKGEKIDACWNGTEITDKTLEQWQRMQKQGWFCKHPFGDGGRQCPPFAFN